MQLKLFVGHGAHQVEKEANYWLSSTPQVEVIKTEMAVSLIPMPPGVGASVPIEERVTLTIWYRRNAA